MSSNWNSPEGMITKIWGPMIWHYLHTLSFNYPVEPTQKQKKDYSMLIFSIGRTLPCKFCRQNFEQNIKDVPLNSYALKNRDTFSRWMYRFHSHINKMLGKKTDITYKKVREKYNSYRASSCSEMTTRTIKSKVKKSEKGCHSKKRVSCNITVTKGGETIK